MRRIPSVAVMVFYILIACTLLSLKIESMMMTQAVTCTLDSVHEKNVSVSALFWDNSGNHLYYAEEGIGWDNGLRIKEFDKELYFVNPGSQRVEIDLFCNWEVIMTASREPRSGEKINIINDRISVYDRYLLVYQEGVPRDLSEIADAKLIAQGNNAAIIEASNAKSPFLEHDVKNQFVRYQQQGWTIYSLNSIEKMISAIPKIALVFVLFLIPAVLLILFCVVSRVKGKLLWINAGVSFISLILASPVLSKIDLPPSLLPANNIFDFSHYMHMFSEIEHALECLQYEETLSMLKQTEIISMWVAIIGCVSAALLVIVEARVRKRLQLLDS